MKKAAAIIEAPKDRIVIEKINHPKRLSFLIVSPNPEKYSAKDFLLDGEGVKGSLLIAKKIVPNKNMEKAIKNNKEKFNGYR